MNAAAPDLEHRPGLAEPHPALEDRAAGLPRLNIGCGPVQPDGWINIDSSHRARVASRLPWLDRALVALRLLPPTEFHAGTATQDVRRPLRYADGSIAAIYSGELLEHLTFEEGRRLLAECHRVLAPGGVLRVRVPDNFHFWEQYVEEFREMRTLPREAWRATHSRWVRMFFDDICVRRPGLGSMGHFHKWMYDEVSLVLAFEEAGFSQVGRARLHESRIPDVALVETRDDLIVEGVKPYPSGTPARAPSSSGFQPPTDDGRWWRAR